MVAVGTISASLCSTLSQKIEIKLVSGYNKQFGLAGNYILSAMLYPACLFPRLLNSVLVVSDKNDPILMINFHDCYEN